MTVRVLVVEDEELSAQAHAAYVRRTAGFELAGVARSSVEAVRVLRSVPVDLVLLDMHLPDGHGLALLQGMRAEGFLCDVIAVTAARDVEVVKRAVSQGVVLYLLKPFTYAGFRTKLDQYADYRARLTAAESDVGQQDVDEMLGVLRTTPQRTTVPKGMSVDTLREVTVALRDGVGRSASELAAAIGTSRVTARRYLEYLAAEDVVERSVRYGGSGRPEVEYRWTGA
ncbi:response regulator [Nocardioides panacis]|uniref:Transcriptional regulatory protein n=1 Tax=Nocardioides panacis TaxID=2849501 RepID=A0A975T1F0_9ACTN|nr:response regulator [Nocardioides panacis]QWZ09114.1 response regulator [Nocardioides panacis]